MQLFSHNFANKVIRTGNVEEYIADYTCQMKQILPL